MPKIYPVLGHSMRFTLEPGDAVAAETCDPRDLRAGELALLVKWDGGRPSGYVIHRVLLNVSVLGRRFFLSKGDANFLPDLPPAAFQPAGRVTGLEIAGNLSDYAPGPSWPLAAAYSFAANKLLSWTVYAAYFAFRACSAVLPPRAASLLNPIQLLWETGGYPRLLSLASAPLRPSAGGRAPGKVKTGRITSDETWSGDITVADYLTIAPGASVRVEPGTRINFTRAEPWFFPVYRAGTGSSFSELDSAHAKILVYGAFTAAGTPEAPVAAGGPSFGGIQALGGGAVSLTNCVLSGAQGCALGAWDASTLAAERTVLASCRRGADLRGQAAAFFKDCSVSVTGGAAVRAADDASLLFSGGAAESLDEAPLFEFSGGARAALYACRASGRGCGVAACGSVRLIFKDFRAADCLRGAALLRGTSSLEASGCELADSAFGLAVRDGSCASLYSCRVSGHRGPAAEVDGTARFSAAGSSFSGSSAGILAAGANRLDLSSCEFSRNAGPGLKLLGRNGVALSGCVFTGGESGVEGSGANTITLTDAAFRGVSGPGLKLLGHNSAGLLACLFEKGESGVEGTGRNTLTMEDSAFIGVSGPAVDLERAAGVSAASCVFSGCGEGLVLRDTAAFRGFGLRFEGNAGSAVCAEGLGEVRLKNSAFAGNGAGLYLDGQVSAEVSGCVLEGQRGHAAYLRGRSAGRFSACAFSGGTSGLKLAGRAEAAAENCSLLGASGSAADLAGSSRLRLRNSSVSGPGAAVLATEDAEATLTGVRASSEASPSAALEGRGSLHAAESSFSSCADAAYCSGEGRLALERCSLSSSGAAALNMRSGTAALTGCALSGRGGILAAAGTLALDRTTVHASDFGVECGASFSASSVTVRGGSRGGVLLSGPAAALSGFTCEGAPYPGISAGRLTRLKASGISVGGAAWAPPAPAPRGSRLKAALFSFVSSTARTRPFSAVYRLIYSAAPAAAAMLLRGRGVAGLYLYRGMAQKDWVPGLSDMDLACALAPAAPDREFGAYSSLRRRLKALRAVFPFTGEVMTAAPAELSAFFSRWGAKAQEFPAASRLLAGAGLPAVRAVPSPAADPTEAFYAYTLLLRNFFSGGAPEPFLRRNCLKNLVDIRRYLDVSHPSRLSRRDYARCTGLPLEDFMALEKGEAAWQAFRALHAASPQAAPSAEPVRPAAGGWFNSEAFEAACGAMSDRAGVPLSVALDPLYRVYAVLPDEAAGDRAAYLRACAALREAGAAFPALGASPLVLTRSSFSLLCRLPYLNNPSLWKDLSSVPGGEGPQDGGIYTRGPLPLAVPPPEVLRASAAAAAVHFCASWRSLWGEMPPHYFYTRAAGLRLLLETGDAPAFSSPEGLRAACAAAGMPLPSWRDFLAGGACGANYGHVAAQCSRLGRFLNAA